MYHTKLINLLMVGLVALATPTLAEPMPAWEEFRIDGPAVPDIWKYLSTTRMECPRSDQNDCTIGSLMEVATTFYGKFPTDPAKYVVVFVTTPTGGNSDYMMALVFKDDLSGNFSLVGKAEEIYGVYPHEVRFRGRPDHKLRWVRSWVPELPTQTLRPKNVPPHRHGK